MLKLEIFFSNYEHASREKERQRERIGKKRSTYCNDVYNIAHYVVGIYGAYR